MTGPLGSDLVNVRPGLNASDLNATPSAPVTGEARGDFAERTGGGGDLILRGEERSNRLRSLRPRDFLGQGERRLLGGGERQRLGEF